MSISVVIPAYNAEGLIEQALDSITKQAVRPTEIIVVDDGSDDRTAEIVELSLVPGLQLVRQNNAGPATARNAAIAMAKGEWIAFLDADDLWLPCKLAVQTLLSAERPEVDIWLGATEGVGIEVPPPAKGAFPSDFTSRAFLQLGASLIRRSVFERIGHFDSSLTFAEDVDWFMRAREGGAVMETHDETVLRYRRHSGNLTNQIEQRDRGFMRALKNSIERRRTAETMRA